MPNARNEIVVKEVFCSCFTWADLESLFCINRKFLKEDLKNFLKCKPNPEERIEAFYAKIMSNEEHRQFDSER